MRPRRSMMRPRRRSFQMEASWLGCKLQVHFVFIFALGVCIHISPDHWAISDHLEQVS
jgi:hypothetical protein